MSEQEPTKPYVFQPYGSLTHLKYASKGRLWGVAGVDGLATIVGLTKKEAEAIVESLIGLIALNEVLAGLK